MKVLVDYEFQAKIHDEVDLNEYTNALSYEDFVKKFSSSIDTYVRQLLADECADHNINFVNVKRINLKFGKMG